jgi:hypothetical protein
MAHPTLAAAMLIVCALAFVVVGWAVRARVPAVSLGLLGALVGGGATFGFVVARGRPGALAATSVGASFGLVCGGVAAFVACRARPPSRPLLRGAVIVLVAAPILAVPLALLLRFACPLYVHGTRTGICDYGTVDQLGGWLTQFVLAFLFDAAFVAALMRASGWQARHTEIAVERSPGSSTGSTIEV